MENSQKKKKSFVLYADFEPALMRMTVRERGMLFTMIYSYVNRGYAEVIFKPTAAVEMAFDIIRAQLDRDAEKYERSCKRNFENGKLGGRPKKKNEEEKTQKTQWVFEKPKKPDNDNENENDNDNDNDIYIDNDNYGKVTRSFDAAEFFAAALARSYGEEKEKEKEK